MEQKKNTFDKVTMGKIMRSALIAGGGVVLTVILQGIAGMDFGAYTPMVTALSSWAIVVVKEYAQGE